MGVEKENIYFHISDEPGEADLEHYRSLSAVLLPMIEGCNQIDALSRIDFYNTGAVKTPVVGTNDLEHFFEAGVEHLWCYYCCAQGKEVANRFMAMPSERNRIIGTQMYLHNIEGFLHWGFNFYNSQLSKKHINPYEVTDAEYAFPSGDPFSVYPYKDGATHSIRSRVFYDGLQDIRTFELLETVMSHEEVVALIENYGTMTLDKYPTDYEILLKIKQDAHKIIREKIAKYGSHH